MGPFPSLTLPLPLKSNPRVRKWYSSRTRNPGNPSPGLYPQPLVAARDTLSLSTKNTDTAMMAYAGSILSNHCHMSTTVHRHNSNQIATKIANNSPGWIVRGYFCI
jgi:hypothetical protein